MWTHGAIVDDSCVDKVLVVGEDFNAYTLGYDNVLEACIELMNRAKDINF